MLIAASSSIATPLGYSSLNYGSKNQFPCREKQQVLSSETQSQAAGVSFRHVILLLLITLNIVGNCEGRSNLTIDATAEDVIVSIEPSLSLKASQNMTVESGSVVLNATKEVNLVGEDVHINGDSWSNIIYRLGSVEYLTSLFTSSRVYAWNTYTIQIYETDTEQEIQDKISYAPKHIEAFATLEIIFNAGTYSLNTALIFSNFYGAGTLHIHGDPTLGEGVHATQSTKLVAVGVHGIMFLEYITTGSLVIENIEFAPHGSVSSVERAIHLFAVSSKGFIKYNTFIGNYDMGGLSEGVRCDYSRAWVQSNYFSKCSYCVVSSVQAVVSVNSNEGPDTNYAAHYADYNAIVFGTANDPNLLSGLGGVAQNNGILA